MSKLTDEQKKNYLERSGIVCPFCDSGNVQGDSVDIDEGYLTQDVRCHDCKEEWTDVYTLTNVETEADRQAAFA